LTNKKPYYFFLFTESSK